MVGSVISIQVGSTASNYSRYVDHSEILGIEADQEWNLMVPLLRLGSIQGRSHWQKLSHYRFHRLTVFKEYVVCGQWSQKPYSDQSGQFQHILHDQVTLSSRQLSLVAHPECNVQGENLIDMDGAESFLSRRCRLAYGWGTQKPWQWQGEQRWVSSQMAGLMLCTWGLGNELRTELATLVDWEMSWESWWLHLVPGSPITISSFRSCWDLCGPRVRWD